MYKKDTKLLDEETLPEVTDLVTPKYQMNPIGETISCPPPLLSSYERRSHHQSHTAQLSD